MKSIIFYTLGTLLLVQTVSLTRTLRPLFTASGTPDKDKTGCYIVVLKEETTHEMFQSILSQVVRMSTDTKVHGSVERVAKAFTVKLSDDALRRVRSLPEVKYVEEDGKVTAQQGNDTVIWHLDRLDQYNLPLDNIYHPNGTGEGVDIYIVDSGINYDHEEFENRAEYGGFDISGLNGVDSLGHGTHMASLAAGKTYGTAKKARLYSIRVFDRYGRVYWSWVVRALNYISYIIPLRGRPAVVSMSISGYWSTTVDYALTRLHSEGIILVGSAGAERGFECWYSPGRSPHVITVGASNADDGIYFENNMGSCIDIFAPGEEVAGAGISCTTCVETMTGTSAAAALVSGIAAVHLEHNSSLTPDQMKMLLTSTASPGVLNFTTAYNQHYLYSTPNRLLYIGSPVSETPNCTEPEIDNGKVSYTGLTAGSTATFSCAQPHFPLRGNTTSTCTFLGTWYPELPECIVKCKEYSAPDYGYKRGGSGSQYVSYVYPGTALEYGCHSNFFLHGDAFVMCLGNGSWTGSNTRPWCERQCKELRPINNGSVTNQGNRLISTVVTYVCDDGYFLLGEAQRRCITTDDYPYRTWTGSQPQCLPIPSPPIVRALCSDVLWHTAYGPPLPCSDIIGYDVMLYEPGSLHLSLTRRVAPDATFYTITTQDNTTIDVFNAYVKVRSLTWYTEGEWSESMALGCTRPRQLIIHGVYFELNGEIYLNNSAVSLADIGEGDRALLCKTDKQDCCGTVLNVIGEFYYPNGTEVGAQDLSGGGFYCERATQVIGLNRRYDVSTPPNGSYHCEIPSASSEMANIYITLTE